MPLWDLGFTVTVDYNTTEDPGIAIIGMAGRFPGAENSTELWQNLCAGVESITFFTEEELDAGIDPRLKNNPAYVRAKGVLRDGENFDAAFFAVPPREAQIMDPQQRIFLETAWEALEDAGYAPGLFQCLTGVFGGAGYNTYFIKNVLPNQSVYQSVGEHQSILANAPDYLATRVSYKLDLKGPSISLYTGCSSSLVAVSCAFDSLLSYQCDLALAGGVFVSCPQNSGYLYQKGEIFSADGHCRPFDALANGTVFSNGAGIVVLKRLEDALRDKDNIYAVIRGTAVNNDGSQKASFAAPSVGAQAEVVAMAMASANVHPETITYIETHGTGTLLGDPMEIEALTQAFRTKTSATNYCALGSIKGNLGHLDAAAGVVGLIKTALALKNKLIPPSLHFEQANPEIAFSTSPFYVNTELTAWPAVPSPRRAGVTALGVGGTNVHVIVEEAPEREHSSPSRPVQLLLISAKTASALETATARLGSFLQEHPSVPLADVAYTLQSGRKGFRYRRFALCTDLADAVAALQALASTQTQTRLVPAASPDVVFMFPGQGSQYVNMGLDLYNHEKIFRQTVDHCAEILMEFLHQDLREILYPQDKDQEQAAASLCRTSIQQPALFTIEYALTKLWEKWGVRPAAMIGHSLGEYVAACLAGVFSLDDALMLVSARGRLMQELAAGSMLSVRMPATEVELRLEGQLSLAAVNSPSLCVIAGPTSDIERFRYTLEQEDVMCRHLKTSHAFHSSMVEAIVEPFAALVKTVTLSAPKIPYVSTATGTWITPEQATDPQFWGTQLRRTVRFAQGLGVVLETSDRVLLEVGPGSTTATLARQQLRDRDKQIVVASLGAGHAGSRESTALSYALGQLWLSGTVIDWPAFYQNEQRHRVSLPTYPFERRRHWLDPPALEQHGGFLVEQLAEEHKKIQAGGTDMPQKMHDPLRPEPMGAAAPYDEPHRHRIARKMASIWQDLLGGKAISPHDNFFDLGGDSLVAARLMTQIEKHFQTSIGPQDLLNAPTLTGLVDLIHTGHVPASPATDEDMPYTVTLGNAAAHKQDIFALWSRNYPNLTTDRFDWLYQGNPYGSATCFFVKHQKTKQLVGIHAIFPRRVFIRGHPFMAGLGGDLAIDKEHRILAPALLLQNTVLSECGAGGLDLFYGFPNSQSQAVNTMLGLQMLDVVRMTRPLKSQYYIQRCLRSQTISKTLAKTIDSITRRLARETRYKRSTQGNTEILSEFDERFDTLWQEASAQFTIIGERTRTYLDWRYRRSPHHRHTIFALSDTTTNALLGYVVFHTDNQKTYIDDMLCRDIDKDFDAVLAEFLLLQRQNDMETVSISFAGSKRFMNKLHAFGFFVRDKEGKVTVYAAPERDYQPALVEADNWYLMPGDKDI